MGTFSAMSPANRKQGDFPGLSPTTSPANRKQGDFLGQSPTMSPHIPGIFCLFLFLLFQPYYLWLNPNWCKSSFKQNNFFARYRISLNSNRHWEPSPATNRTTALTDKGNPSTATSTWNNCFASYRTLVRLQEKLQMRVRQQQEQLYLKTSPGSIMLKATLPATNRTTSLPARG